MSAKAERRRKAIVILGMHRSGSSAMTRVISLLGAQLPAKLMPSYTHNVPGHWEPQEVADLNDDILEELDSAWDDPLGPCADGGSDIATPDRVTRARKVIADNYEGSDDIVLKEPRIAVVHAIWRRALEEEGFELNYIIMVRSPHDVAASLKTRDDMALDAALLLWTTYMLASLKATKGQRRVFVAFDRLLENPGREVRRIEQALDHPFPPRDAAIDAEIQAFVDPGHRHEQVGDSTLPKGLQPIARLADYVERAAEDLPADEDAPDAVADWLAQTDAMAGPMLRRAAAESVERQRMHDRRASTIDALQHQYGIQQEKLDARVVQAEAQATRIADLEKAMAGAGDANLAALRLEFDAQQQTLDARVAQAEAQAIRITDLERALGERIAQAEAQHAMLLELGQVLEESKADTLTHRAASGALQQTLLQAERGRDEAHAALTALQRKADERLAIANASLTATAAELEAAKANAASERSGRLAVEARVATLDDELTAAQAACASANTALAEARDKIVRQSSDLETSQTQIDALTHHVAALKTDLAQVHAARATLQDALALADDASAQQARDMAALRDQLFAAENQPSRALAAELSRRAASRVGFRPKPR